MSAYREMYHLRLILSADYVSTSSHHESRTSFYLTYVHSSSLPKGGGQLWRWTIIFTHITYVNHNIYVYILTHNMYVCVCVCVYIYIYTYTYTCKYTYSHINIYNQKLLRIYSLPGSVLNALCKLFCSSLHQGYNIGIIIYSLWQMRKLRYKEVQLVASGHCQDTNAGCLSP